MLLSMMIKLDFIDMRGNPGANHSVLKYLSVKQKGMWEALVLLIGLVWTWCELRGHGQKLCLLLH